MYDGKIDQKDLIRLEHSVLIDFGGLFSKHRETVKLYLDLSASQSYLEAINNVYDTLRIAETREDAQFVLITNIFQFQE